MKQCLFSLLLAVLAVGGMAQDWVDAEVRKVDKAAGKITLKHGEIKNLDMPAMTMVFRIKDARLLDGLAEGSKVRFAAQKVDGQFTVTHIQAAP